MHLIVRAAHASLGDLMYGVSCDRGPVIVTSRRHLGTESGVWSHHTPSQAGDKFTESDMFPVRQQSGSSHNNRDRRTGNLSHCVTQAAYFDEQGAKCEPLSLSGAPNRVEGNGDRLTRIRRDNV